MERDRRGGHNRKSINENFFKNWSPKMAYVLGFLYADGAVEDCRKSSRTCYLSIVNTDLKILEDIRMVLSSEHNIQVRRAGEMKIRGKTYYRRDCYVLRIGNKMMYQDLLGYGLCPRKSLVINMPKISSKYLSYFVRGYFDGDGCVHREKRSSRLKIIFSSGSKSFLDQLRDVVSSKGYIVLNRSTYQLIYNGRSAEFVADFIYSDLNQTPYLEYKYNKYLDYLRGQSDLD